MTRLLLLVPLLAACNSHDGSWLLRLSLKDSTDEDAPTVYEVDAIGTLYGLGGGQTAFDLGAEMPLVGIVDGSEFQFSYSYGISGTDENCALLAQETSFSFEGEFTSDLGLEGEISMKDEISVQDCDPYEGEVQENVFDVTGTYINAGEGDHPQGSFAFGGFSGGGQY